MKIIYAGTPEFAVPALRALLASTHQVVAVYTQPDRPAGRGKKLTPSPVKACAMEAGVVVLQPPSLRDAAALQALAAHEADLMVVAAYGLILPLAALQAPRLGCINIHASLLPRWRGAAPIQRAIEAGDNETGVTIMQMAEGLDTGDMLLALRTPIRADDSGGSLHDRLSLMGADALMQALALLEAGKLVPEVQDEALVTYAHKLDKAQAELGWSVDALTLARRIRAFTPWPVCQCGSSLGNLRVWQARATVLDSGESPGTVVQESREHGVLVQCGDGGLWLEQIQLPGKKPLCAKEFLNGRSLLGEVLG